MQKKKNVFALLTSKFERSGDKKFERTFKRKIRKKCFIAKFFSFEKETHLSVNKALKTNRIINKQRILVNLLPERIIHKISYSRIIKKKKSLFPRKKRPINKINHTFDPSRINYLVPLKELISLGTTKDAIKAFVSVEMEEQSRSPNEETPCSKTYFYRVKETSTHRGTVSSDRINPKEVSTDSVCLSSAPRLFIQR